MDGWIDRLDRQLSYPAGIRRERHSRDITWQRADRRGVVSVSHRNSSTYKRAHGVSSVLPMLARVCGALKTNAAPGDQKSWRPVHNTGATRAQPSILTGETCIMPM